MKLSLPSRGGGLSPSENLSGDSKVVLVKYFDIKYQVAACAHLGLQLQKPKFHVYQPYEYNFSSIDIPEVVQDCGADGDCFYR